MSWVIRNRARIIVVTLALFGLQISARAATKVAVIDGAGGAGWCSFLVNNGYDCTLYPATGPTASLDPFQIIVNLSNVWSDPDDSLAEQMQAGKGVVTWGDAPQALQIINKPLVQAWIGADGHAGGSNRVFTTALDPILAGYPIGSEIADCGDGGCTALGGTEGHPGAKVLARLENGNFVALLRNQWESGRSVYVMDFMGPGSHPDIYLNIFRELGRPIPASSTWGLLIMSMVLLIVGSCLLKRPRVSVLLVAMMVGWPTFGCIEGGAMIFLRIRQSL